MMDSVPPTVILLIATFCTIIIISAIILFLAMNKTPSSWPQEGSSEDLAMYEEQYGEEGRERFTFVYNARCGGYALVGGAASAYSSDSQERLGQGDGQEFEGRGKDSDSDACGSSRSDSRRTPKSNLRSWLFGSRKSVSSGSGSEGHRRQYSGNGLRESPSDLGWDSDDDGNEGTIHISPSRPAMFGTSSLDEGQGEGESGAGGTRSMVKVMLTPPTPAKERVFRAVLVSDSRESI